VGVQPRHAVIVTQARVLAMQRPVATTVRKGNTAQTQEAVAQIVMRESIMIIQSNHNAKTVLAARIIRTQGWATAQHFAPPVQPAKFLLTAQTHKTIVHFAALDSTNQAGPDARTVRRMHGRLKAAQHPPIVNVTLARQGRMEEPHACSAQRESTRTRGVRGVSLAVLIIIA